MVEVYFPIRHPTITHPACEVTLAMALLTGLWKFWCGSQAFYFFARKTKNRECKMLGCETFKGLSLFMMQRLGQKDKVIWKTFCFQYFNSGALNKASQNSVILARDKTFVRGIRHKKFVVSFCTHLLNCSIPKDVFGQVILIFPRICSQEIRAVSPS